MIITEEVHTIAVSLGKSENMRVTAGRMFAKLWEYVATPGNDGAQQVIDAGVPPTQEGVWRLIRADRSYPQVLGTSFAQGRKLLSIGRAPDPEKADAAARAAKANEDAARSAANKSQPAQDDLLHNRYGSGSLCNNEPAASDVSSIIAALRALSTPDLDEVWEWLRGYRGITG